MQYLRIIILPPNDCENDDPQSFKDLIKDRLFPNVQNCSDNKYIPIMHLPLLFMSLAELEKAKTEAEISIEMSHHGSTANRNDKSNF